MLYNQGMAKGGLSRESISCLLIPVWGLLLEWVFRFVFGFGDYISLGFAGRLKECVDSDVSMKRRIIRRVSAFYPIIDVSSKDLAAREKKNRVDFFLVAFHHIFMGDEKTMRVNSAECQHYILLFISSSRLSE